jgi:hypothetical protein
MRQTMRSPAEKDALIVPERTEEVITSGDCSDKADASDPCQQQHLYLSLRRRGAFIFVLGVLFVPLLILAVLLPTGLLKVWVPWGDLYGHRWSLYPAKNDEYLLGVGKADITGYVNMISALRKRC